MSSKTIPGFVMFFSVIMWQLDSVASECHKRSVVFKLQSKQDAQCQSLIPKKIKKIRVCEDDGRGFLYSDNAEMAEPLFPKDGLWVSKLYTSNSSTGLYITKETRISRDLSQFEFILLTEKKGSSSQKLVCVGQLLMQ
ncbi:MAG: hypothetical protein L6Q37_11095 [Bdellovibrionaceae bacterium]|nr:hypothetical protein [Pseudobdellovibrionaceae bacterium]